IRNSRIPCSKQPLREMRVLFRSKQRVVNKKSLIAVLGTVLLIGAGLVAGMPSGRAQNAGECSNPQPGWVLCEDFEQGDFLTNWGIESNLGTWPRDQFVRCDSFGFGGSCAAWSNNLVSDNFGGYYGYDARRPFPPQSELYIRWYKYISNPYQRSEEHTSELQSRGH